MLMFFRFSTETQVTNGYMYAFINDFIMKNHDAQIWQTLTIVIMRLSNDATTLSTRNWPCRKLQN